MFRYLVLSAMATLLPLAAQAETDRVSIAEQYGIAYLPLTVMRDQALFDKRLHEAGLSPTVTWTVFSGAAPMTDAVLSGSLDFASGAFSSFILLWNKSRGAVRAIAPLPATPLYFLTIQPGLERIADIGPGSRVALPAVGVSTQAFLLQYVAAQAFGADQYRRFDALTVTMAHPDAANMLAAGRTEVNGHFSAPPFQAAELRNPAIRRIGSSYDILGGMHTSSVAWCPVRFHDANPKTFMAFLLAYQDASKLIQSNPGLAAQAYVRQTGSREKLESVTQQIADPELDFGLVPMKLDMITGLLFDTKRLPTRPDIDRDVFFPELRQLTDP